MDGRILYPLTHPQKRIWLTEKLHPGTGMWNNAGTAKVKGPLDVGSLELAVNHVIKSNEALRICITQVNGEPFQYVRGFQYRELEVFDFSQKGLSDLYEWDAAQSQTSMPLLDQDLCYFAVLKISDQEWGLYGKMHHIISDAWSAVMVCDQIMENYDKLLSGLEMQEQVFGSYIDCIEKEKEYLDSKRFLKDGEAMSEVFSNLPEPTVFKQKKSNYTSLRARRKPCIINKGLADRAREYCKQNDTSIFSLYLAGLCVYINRILNKDDIIIGVPVFNRTTREEKNTVGMFVSTVPVRIKVEDGMAFGDFVKVVSSEWFRILKHQKYPYELLLSNLRKSNKDLDSLYDIALSYQNAQFRKNTANFTYEARWHFTGSQVGSLSIHINDREGEGRLIVDYDHQVPLFSLKEIEYIHSHCETILTDAISHPDKKIYELDIMEPEELNRILYDFNANKAEYPQDRGLDALFLQQMKKTPEAVALVAGTESLTYAQLNSLVNKLAFDLRNRGIDRNSVVGVVIRRDYTLIAGILAVIRAGGAFLPIDPDFPSDRIQLILKESGAQLAIASPDVAEKCSGVCKVFRTDCLDSIPEYLQEIPSNNHMQDLAYVIYTSGSTGKPKGVMVEQRSIVHFMFALSDVLDFSPGNIILSLATISFDVFIKETMPTLMNGGTIVLAGEAETYSPTYLAALMERTGVNKFMFTPTRMQLLMLEKKAEVCLKNMKEIILGGEVLQKKLLDDIRKRTAAKILYFYGPTEATIAATYKDLTESSSINIGKPLANMNLYILDKHRNPVPIGTEGEIFIGGISVARGYLNSADQTKKSFLENPFKKGETIYKTGDIARWYPMGEIQFIGRTDEQVKIRGLRIELGEIGNAISECNGIEKAFVVDYRKEESHYLCSYYTKNGDVNESELRNSLRKKLPVYMIPSYFIELDQFPMTPSGKLDKNALPSPQFITPEQKETRVKGLSFTEKKMAAIWKKVLKVDKVSKEDNFFELGGDSLAVIRVQSEILRHGIEFKIQDFYELETLCAICERIDSQLSDKKLTVIQDSKTKPNNVQSTSYTQKGSEPLKDRILTGRLPRLDSAALTYMPDIIDFNGLGNVPTLYNHINTGFGTVGVIALPISIRDIYYEKSKLISLSIKGIQLAEELGAKVVSLTGLIPSATEYGLELADACTKICPEVRITTGHTTTAASVILSLERLLQESGRSIINEDICVLGLGSIGTTVIQLLLSVLPHPASITLCDIYPKKSHLNRLELVLQNEYRYNRKIRISCAEGTVLPDEVYDSTLIIGATNVSDLLNVARLRAGTLIIDDSGPHCFSKDEAVKRLRVRGDILFTEGGVLQTPNPLIKTTFLSPSIKPNILEMFYQHFLSTNEITGCILSSLLSAKYEHLKTVVGMVRIEDCKKHYHLLRKLNFCGAPLHCDDYEIPVNIIKSFKGLFSRQVGTSIAK